MVLPLLAALALVNSAQPEAAAPGDAAKARDLWVVQELKGRKVAIEPATNVTRELPYDTSQRGEISPDGTWEVFLGSGETAKAFDLYMTEAAKRAAGEVAPSDVRRVTAMDAQLSSPKWMSDSRHVVFVSGHWSERTVWKVEAAAALPSGEGEPPKATRFSQGKDPAYGVEASKRGPVSYLALREQKGKEQKNDVVVVRGDQHQAVLRGEHVTSTAWSPDGGTLAIGVIDAVVLWNLDDGSTRRIRFSEADQRLLNSTTHALSWRPDGKVIATAPRFVGGRTVGTVLFHDNKIALLSLDTQREPHLVLVGEENVNGLGWIEGEAVRAIDRQRFHDEHIAPGRVKAGGQSTPRTSE